MPNINTKTLERLNVKTSDDIKQPEGSSMCGAYALVGAVGAFGHRMDREDLHYKNHGPDPVDRKASLKGVQSFHDRCKVVYRITGILNNNPPPDLKQRGKDLGNSPAAMAQVALQLGMHINIYAQKAAMEELLKIYKGAKRRCIDAVGEENTHADARQYEPPGENETSLILVQRISNRNMHWLTQGSDGKFYDPIDGSTTNLWHPRKLGDRLGDSDYRFLGLWMTVNQ